MCSLIPPCPVVTFGFASESQDVFEYEGVVVLPLVLRGGTLDQAFTVRVEVVEKTAKGEGEGHCSVVGCALDSNVYKCGVQTY